MEPVAVKSKVTLSPFTFTTPNSPDNTTGADSSSTSGSSMEISYNNEIGNPSNTILTEITDGTTYCNNPIDT